MTNLENRRDFCIKKAMNFLPNEIGRLYINENFDRVIKQKVKDMADRIVAEFKEMLVENDWMDEKSKTRALDKAACVIAQIGYPDYYDDPAYIENNYNVIEET